MATMFERNCAHCGAHYRGMGKSFCGNLCRTNASRNRIEFTCKNCGVQCVRPASLAKHDAAEFCSRPCWYSFAKGRGLTGAITTQEFKCSACGKMFTARPTSHKRRYCSIECQHAGRPPCPKRRVARLTVTCVECGKEFKKLPCQRKGGKGRFCSRACNAYDSLKRRTRTFSSAVEVRFFDECEGRGVRLTRQVRIGRYSLDAATLDCKIAFEFDGDYWHSLPAVRLRDQRKDIALAAMGIKVIRIPEMLYYKNPAAAIDLVLSATRG